MIENIELNDIVITKDLHIENDPEIDLIKSYLKLEEYKKKTIIDSWTQKHLDLLEMWAEKSAGYRWLHMKCSNYYKFITNLFAYPIIILSSLVGVGGFAIITPNPTDYELVLQYIFSGVNILIAILSSCQKFNKCSEYTELHNAAVINYAKFYRQIKLELSVEPENRGNAIQFCRNMKDEYDKILTTSPEILPTVIDDFNTKFKHIKHKPDVANGLLEIEQKHGNSCENV